MVTKLPNGIQAVIHFLAVVSHGSINRTASSLNLSQAGLTKSINTLEQQIAGQLFVRGPKGARLTHLGNTFLRHAILFDNQRVRVGAAILAETKGLDIELRIGVSMAWAVHLVMPDVLARFQADVH